MQHLRCKNARLITQESILHVYPDRLGERLEQDARSLRRFKARCHFSGHCEDQSS